MPRSATPQGVQLEMEFGSPSGKNLVRNGHHEPYHRLNTRFQNSSKKKGADVLCAPSI